MSPRTRLTKPFKKHNFFRFRDNESQFSPGQFQRPPRPIPWKAIGFAIFLFLGGSALLIVGALILAGYITQAEWVAKGRPFIILGSLMFIPGFYHVRLAYYAWKGYEGYDFEQIPDYDD